MYKIMELPKPEPGPLQVRIRIVACGIGYVDALVALGKYQVKPPLPHVPGGEVAGFIDAVGDGVSSFTVGNRVLAKVRGGFAEYGIARSQDTKFLPEVMTYHQAAGFQVNYVTALHGLRDRGALKAGETLLVFGAAGGAGLAAVEVGRALGARIIAVASSEEKREFVRAAGADEVIDRDPEGWRDRLKALVPAGPDIIFDPACGELMEPAFRSLRWRGRYLIVGFASGQISSLRVNLSLLKGASLIGVDYRQFSQVFEQGEGDRVLDELLELVACKRLAVPIGKVFSFGDFKSALEYALSGQGVSKTLLSVDAEQAD
jgi:NADPH:quinone reductase